MIQENLGLHDVAGQNEFAFTGIFVGMSLNVDTIKITPEILALIAEIDEFKGVGRGIVYIPTQRG